MEQVGSDSWRVVFDPRPALLERALFVREVAGLLIESHPEIPPQLLEEVPDQSRNYSARWRASTGVRWISWWQELVQHVGACQLVFLDSGGALARQPSKGIRAVPPPFPWAGDDPSVATAIGDVLELAAKWSGERKRILLERRPPSLVTPIENERISAIAIKTAARLNVPLGMMRAVVLTLSVRGAWSSQPSAGVLLCSESVLEDEDQLESVLADTFISGCDAEQVAAPAVPFMQHPGSGSVLDSPLLIANEGGTTLWLAGVHQVPGGFELELSRSGDSTHPQPRPYPTGQGQPRDPQTVLDYFSGLEVEIRFELDPHGDSHPSEVRNSPVASKRFWRRGSGPNSLWLLVGVEQDRGHVTVTATWPECQIYRHSVEFELTRRESDAGS